MAGILEYSSDRTSNTTINGIGITGSDTVKHGNDAIQQLMADLRTAVTKITDKGAGSYTAVKADHNQCWRVTGTATINLTAAATLTAGWCLWVMADGATATIDPAGSEKINGGDTLALTDGNAALIFCTATDFRAIIFNAAFGATEVGDALLTAANKAAGRSAIDALGPDETPDKAFRRGNILGTVSQVGGVPTGALIEYGSNANGEYVRFANGTQICVKRMSFPGAVDTATGSLFFSSAKDLGSWPAAFVASPYRSALQRGAVGLYSGNAPTETSAGAIIYWRPTSTPSIGDPDVDIIGIGRWF